MTSRRAPRKVFAQQKSQPCTRDHAEQRRDQPTGAAPTRSHKPLELGHLVGNRAMTGWVQTKPEVGRADDPAEREADAIAERVIHQIRHHRQHDELTLDPAHYPGKIQRSGRPRAAESEQVRERGAGKIRRRLRPPREDSKAWTDETEATGRVGLATVTKRRSKKLEEIEEAMAGLRRARQAQDADLMRGALMEVLSAVAGWHDPKPGAEADEIETAASGIRLQLEDLRVIPPPAPAPPTEPPAGPHSVQRAAAPAMPTDHVSKPPEPAVPASE